MVFLSSMSFGRDACFKYVGSVQSQFTNLQTAVSYTGSETPRCLASQEPKSIIAPQDIRYEEPCLVCSDLREMINKRVSQFVQNISTAKEASCPEGCEATPKALVRWEPAQTVQDYKERQICETRLNATREKPIQVEATFSDSGTREKCVTSTRKKAMAWLEDTIRENNDAGKHIYKECPDPCAFYNTLNFDVRADDNGCETTLRIFTQCGHPRVKIYTGFPPLPGSYWNVTIEGQLTCQPPSKKQDQSQSQREAKGKRL